MTATPTTTIKTELDSSEVLKMTRTFYVDKSTGVKYGTPKNWREEGLNPVTGATPTILTTKTGYEVTLFNETEVAKYDKDAEKTKREEMQKLEKQRKELTNSFLKREITPKQFTARDEEISQAIALLASI